MEENNRGTRKRYRDNFQRIEATFGKKVRKTSNEQYETNWKRVGIGDLEKLK